MRTWWVALMLASACTTQGVERARRWPTHRQQGDARFGELERRNTELEEKSSDVERRLKALEAWVAQAKAASPAVAP